MNKKLLICGAIAAGLLLTACVKKEAPKEDESEQAATTEQVTEPVQAEPLTPVESNQIEIPTHVEVERHEIANTTTEIRREVSEPQVVETKPTESKPTAKAEAPKAEDKPTQATQQKPSNTPQSEDDAVAAAIAAATPALEN